MSIKPKVYEAVFTYYRIRNGRYVNAGIQLSSVVARNKENAIRYMLKQRRESGRRQKFTMVILEKSWFAILCTLILPKYVYKASDRHWEKVK